MGGALMKGINISEGVETGKMVILSSKNQEFRMPPYEQGKLAVFDGNTRTVGDDKGLAELSIDGKEPLVCGELQDEWLEDCKWGAFGHTIYEADYLKHREYIIFNPQTQG